jgi:hypothetical protein
LCHAPLSSRLAGTVATRTAKGRPAGPAQRLPMKIPEAA